LIGSGVLALLPVVLPVPVVVSADGTAGLAVLRFAFFFVVFGCVVVVSLVCCACAVSGRAAGSSSAAAIAVVPNLLSKRTMMRISLAPLAAAQS